MSLYSDFVGVGSSLKTYSAVSELPLSNNGTGDQAFITANNRLYLWNGSGWYSVALLNLSPTTITGNDASYSLATDGTPLVITLVSEDPEGFPLTWSHSISSGALGNIATIEQTDNVFTITPSTNSANAGSFGITFSATEGTNITTSISSFTLGFFELTSQSGGIVSSYGDYTVITWLGNGNMVFTGGMSADILIVAGGGGGGGYSGGGGGGAGGMVVLTNQSVPGGTYSVVVGAGGTGGSYTGGATYGDPGLGTAGGDSSFGNMVATGGGSGYGRWAGSTVYAVANGGSGGGRGTTTTTVGGGTGIAGQGYAGGDGNNDNYYNAGGGGGAGAVGADATNSGAGAGGDGLDNNFRTGSNITYAGGGGGGSFNSNTGVFGPGGSGGGGTGSKPGTNVGHGQPNTGGGGGGQGHAGHQQQSGCNGGNGGSGIVVIRYLT